MALYVVSLYDRPRFPKTKKKLGKFVFSELTRPVSIDTFGREAARKTGIKAEWFDVRESRIEPAATKLQFDFICCGTV